MSSLSHAATSPQSAWDDFRKRLQDLRKEDQRVSVIQGGLIWMAGLCLFVLVAVSLEAAFRFSSPVRLTLLLLGSAVALLLGWRCLLPLLRPLADAVLARRVERRFPELHDRLTMALQLWRQREAHVTYASPTLLDAAIIATIGATRSADFTAAAAPGRIRRASKFLGGTILAGGLAWIFLSAPFSDAFGRLMHPLADYPVPQRTFITVEPGNVETPVGGRVTVTATLTGEIPDEVTLHLFSKRREPARDMTLSRVAAATFSSTLRNMKRSIFYTVEAGDATSPEYEITVIDRPAVTALRMTYRYPEYTRLASRTTTDGAGDIVAVKGTRVTLRVEANQALSSARIVFGDATRDRTMPVAGRAASTTLHVLRDQNYHIELRNRTQAPNSRPARYRITALPDRSPDVRIVAPGRDTELTENMMMPLLISATDDFGFSSMNLVYTTPKGETHRKFIPVDPKVTVVSMPYVWDISNLGLFPEDAVSYFIEVFDNDAISGPKRAVSQTFTVRFPSIVEIYKQLESNGTEQVSKLEEMLKGQQEVKERLQDINRDLAQKTPGKEKNLSWERKKDIESLVAKQEQMAKEALKAARAMEEAARQVEQHDMMNRELIEKLNQLRQLFQEIVTPELLKAMQEVRKSMENLDKQQLTESMKDMERAQEEFMKRLERSLSVLKRMQAEQKMDSAVKKAQELVRRQEELAYATQNAAPRASEQTRAHLAEKQDELGQDTASMQRELNDLAKVMDALQAKMPSEAVRDAAESIRRRQLPQEMSRIGRQLAAGRMSQAAQGQQQMSKSLSRMSQQLQDAQEQMQADQKQEVAGEMRRAMHGLVELSQGQESLHARTARPAGRGSRLKDLAEDQQSLLNGASRIADQLVETSRKSFFLSPQVGQSLGESLSRMQNAGKGLTRQQRGAAMQQQAGAMQALNQTVLALRRAMQNMMSARSATGLMEMMQQLQSMAQQQSGLNEDLSRMMQQGQGKNGERMSMEERARMSKLAAQQEAIRKSLEQLQRENREQSRALGRLSEIEREMQESVRQLRRQQVDPKLIERQQRILSRLLDASRSMRERDFDNKRQSTPGKDLTGRASPDDLPSSLLYRTRSLREDLLRGLREGRYPREYEELIRAYFRALSESPRN